MSMIILDPKFKDSKLYGAKYIDEHGKFQYSVCANVTHHLVSFSLEDTHGRIINFDMSHDMFGKFCFTMNSLAEVCRIQGKSL